MWLALACAAAARAQSDSTWRQHSAAGDSARVHGDWKSYKHHAEILYRELHGHPGTVLALARAEAQLHDTAAAMKWLRQYAAMGLVRDLGADSLLAPLYGSTAWRALLSQMSANRLAVHTATVAFTVPDSDFVAEDIAYDSAGKRFLLSSIREGRIIAMKGGKMSTFARDSGDRAMMALGVDAPRGRLWATASGLPQAEDSLAWDGTAVLRFDLRSGNLADTYDVAADTDRDVYGDMDVARGGDVFFTNSVGGQLYLIRAGSDSIETVVPAGTFASPQQPVVLPDGKRVIVPDYIRGLAIVDRGTGAVTWMENPARAALNGIDGMVLAGRSLIAIQNGVNPNRVVRLTLDQSFTKVVRWTTLEANVPRLVEPTHGVLVGEKFYFIATSGWDRFGPDGTITAGATLARPVVMVIDVK